MVKKPYQSRGNLQLIDFKQFNNRLKIKRLEKTLINWYVTFSSHNYSQSYPQIMWRVFLTLGNFLKVNFLINYFLIKRV